MNMLNSPVPLLGFAAYSGTGKTTLLEKLLPILSQMGIRVAMIKHSHHDFEIDQVGKDSYRLRKAGAQQMLIASAYRSALITEKDGQHEPHLSNLIQQIDSNNIDIILVEGFRHVAFPKIELHRPSLQKDLLFPHDKSIIAIACDQVELLSAQIQSAQLACLALNNSEMMAQFIKQYIDQN
jgi:molybdopterin-guanine dinucleotide biosynthesis protein MobB